MKKYFPHLWAQCAVAQQVYNLLEKTSKGTISRRLGSNRKRMKVLSSIHSKKLPPPPPPPHSPYFYLISLFCESPICFMKNLTNSPPPFLLLFRDLTYSLPTIIVIIIIIIIVFSFSKKITLKYTQLQ